VGDLRRKPAKILDFYRRGVAAGVDVVMTPELVITSSAFAPKRTLPQTFSVC